MKRIEKGERLTKLGLRNFTDLNKRCIRARSVREIRTLSGNVNSEFPENIRPSQQGSQQYPKSPFLTFEVNKIIIIIPLKVRKGAYDKVGNQAEVVTRHR